MNADVPDDVRQMIEMELSFDDLALAPDLPDVVLEFDPEDFDPSDLELAAEEEVDRREAANRREVIPTPRQIAERAAAIRKVR